jgi:muramoyltetrapeptide carboxypeptidase
MTTHLYILSPSGAVLDKTGFRRGVKRLTQMGYRVTIDEAALQRHQRFAGDDETRVAALLRAAKSGANAVLLSRGGYGLSRILDRLPLTEIQHSIRSGCKWIGYSDFTALQLALLAQTSQHTVYEQAALTWAGPLVAADLGREEPDEITLSCFTELLDGSAEGTGWRLSPKTAQNISFEGSIQNALLWGGNLCVLTSLIGTPYFPAPAVTQDGILFLEDVAEHPYRIERMLLQLYHVGILSQQKAVLFGQFSDYKLTTLDKGYSLDGVLNYLQTRLPQTAFIPNLPFGHGPTKVCLPFGAQVDLHRDGRDVFMLWEH